MSLSNFYEESDRNSRKQWGMMGLIALVVFAFIAFAFASIINQPTQNDIEQIISKSSELRELDLFCREIPKPADFNYKFKQLGGNSDKRHITFWYGSNLTFHEIRDFYINYFESNGWSRESLRDEDSRFNKGYMTFRKGKQTFDLEHIVAGKASYVVGCGQEL